MLAPIMTKEMKLFPSQPLPSRVKNVRSRAQSLKEFYAAASSANSASQIGGGGGGTAGGGRHATANSLVLLHEISGGGGTRATAAVRQKNSKSIGHLPTNAAVKNLLRNARTAGAGSETAQSQTNQTANETTSNLAAVTANGREKGGGTVQQHKCSSSLVSLKKPLDSIEEGVEMHPSSSSSPKITSIGQQEPKTPKHEAKNAATTVDGCDGGTTERNAKSTANSQQQQSAEKENNRSSSRTRSSRERKKQNSSGEEEGDREDEKGKDREKNAKSGGGNIISSGCFTMWLRSSKRKKGKAKGGGTATEPTVVAQSPRTDDLAKKDAAKNNERMERGKK
ncbi:hypothetical protein niasHT_032354 [Heterodera trifolii]|uniref:Uncharacterized protein n=1 Tax=Heterodera trifolii TaxID=157864 RepID=A0ABD2HR79_9BILA